VIGTAAMKGGHVMSEENRSLWDVLFGSFHNDEQKQKVREYIIHRIGAGAHFRDVIQEEYVQRNASQVEIDEILDDPTLIEAAHRQMMEDFSSGKVALTSSPSAAQ
jgi:hypothetical protein